MDLRQSMKMEEFSHLYVTAYKSSFINLKVFIDTKWLQTLKLVKLLHMLFDTIRSHKPM